MSLCIVDLKSFFNEVIIMCHTFLAKNFAYIKVVQCTMTKQVYDGIIECEPKFVGKFGDGIKEYTNDIIDGNNVWRESALKGELSV